MENTREPKRGRRLAKLGAALFLVAFVHCGGVTAEPDADNQNADAPMSLPDAPTSDADLGPDSMPPAMRPSSTVQTAGGGLASSTSYRVQLSIGAPQPMGAASSASYRVNTGPGTL